MFLGLTKTRIFILLLCITVVGLFTSSWNLSNFFLNQQTSNESVCSCDQYLPQVDPWRRDFINSSPEPFLSRTNGISEDVFNWWKYMQSDPHNFTVYNTTVDNLFEMFHLTEESTSYHSRICAVVGNSGNLRRSYYGHLIDFHDIIIRMNGARTQGYEADVGNKTTHHVMYPESAVPLANTTHLVLFPFKIKDLLWLLKKFDPREKSAKEMMANKDMVMILNPAFMKYVHDNWLEKKGNYPSTGFLALAFSMHICDKVSVFGFGADRDGNWDHYFETLKNNKLKTGLHAGMHEYEFIQKLHKMEKIRFFKG